MTDLDPAHIAANATGLNVHLRVVPLGHTTYRVVTLRPSMGVRFASNYFHDTWHIVTSIAGAHVLGRLLWGLAFQRQPGTLVMIDVPHLVPTPFEADPSDPIVLVPAGLTRFDREDLARLTRTLRRSPVTPRTIRWHTFGMIAALAPTPDHLRFRSPTPHPDSMLARERMSRRAGMICYSAAPELLRQHGCGIFGIRGVQYGSYFPLAEHRHGRWHYDGEVQVLPNFDEAVASAEVARQETIGDRAITSEVERQAVFRRRDQVEARRRRAYRAAKSTRRRAP